MNYDLNWIREKLGNPGSPKTIKQEPFDYDSRHYKRLCSVGNALPDPCDVGDYTYDMKYMSLQADLFKYLFPICLDTWRRYLLEDRNEYGGYVEQFWSALASKQAFPELLNSKENLSVSTFISENILKRMSKETKLSHVGTGSSPYVWFYNLGSFIVVFPHLCHLWNKWWSMNCEGHAICAVQYISCLLYDDNENPVFSPWTPNRGGGPPQLWEVEGHIYDEKTNQDNINFLHSVLSISYVKSKLEYAYKKINDKTCNNVIGHMLEEFDFQSIVLEERLRKLPYLMEKPKIEVMDWEDVP